MRLKQYLKEELTWREYIEFVRFDRKRADRIMKQAIKNLKLKRIKDVLTKAQKVGHTLDKFQTPDGKWELSQGGGIGPVGTYRSGKTRLVWRIWDVKNKSFQHGQYKNLDKAKKALATHLMRNGLMKIPEID